MTQPTEYQAGIQTLAGWQRPLRGPVTRPQLYYFDDHGRLRRMDYQPEVTNYTPVAHYISGHQAVDGVVVATQRRVHVRNDDRSADHSSAPITLDLFDIEVQ
jgi:hypothetical protein